MPHPPSVASDHGSGRVGRLHIFINSPRRLGPWADVRAVGWRGGLCPPRPLAFRWRAFGPRRGAAGGSSKIVMNLIAAAKYLGAFCAA